MFPMITTACLRYDMLRLTGLYPNMFLKFLDEIIYYLIEPTITLIPPR